MNIKQIFLPLFGALALIGCNNEALEPTSSNETETQPVRLALTMEATADASEMRAVSFDANQNVPPTTHDQYSDWTTHCFLRNADGSKKAYAVINWDATLEGGKVKLKMRGHELQLLPIGSSSAELSPENKPVAGERWSIVGITGGGKLNEERTRVDFAPDAELDKDLQAHQARVPFTFEKAYFTISAASGERAPQISVHFEPQGALLNVYANNKTAQAVQTELKVVSNALSNNGYYDYSEDEAKWNFTHTEVRSEILSRPISINANSGKHYLLWGMPRPETTGLSSVVELADYDISAEGPETKRPEVRKDGFSNAKAYSMGFDIERAWHPLNSIVTTGDVSNLSVNFYSKTQSRFIDLSSLVSEQDILNSGIYYAYDTDIQINLPTGYYLPTIYELGSIFPSKNQFSAHSQKIVFSDTQAKTTRELVQFSPHTEPVAVSSVYRGAGGDTKIGYALRFTKLAGKDSDNSKRTAFRYQHVKIKEIQKDNGASIPLYGLKVTVRYLGNTGDESNYDTEEYWNDSAKNSQDVIITFPAMGHLRDNTTLTALGEYGFFWSSTPHVDIKAAYRIVFGQATVDGYASGGKINYFPLILFKR